MRNIMRNFLPGTSLFNLHTVFVW